MTTRADCERYVGQWVRFRTKYGYHVGLVERVTKDSAIVMSPKRQIPANLMSAEVGEDELERLDLALAWWGGGFGRGGGYPGAGYGGAPGAGAYGRYGGPGYGGWGYGWGRWAVSFLIIYALWGLWFW